MWMDREKQVRMDGEIKNEKYFYVTSQIAPDSKIYTMSIVYYDEMSDIMFRLSCTLKHISIDVMYLNYHGYSQLERMNLIRLGFIRLPNSKINKKPKWSKLKVFLLECS